MATEVGDPARAAFDAVQAAKVAKVVASLRAAAEWLEGAGPIPDGCAVQVSDAVPVFVWAETPDELAAATRWLAQGSTPTDPVTKVTGDLLMIARRSFGRLHLEATAMRSKVCERVKVGTTTVMRPDPSVEVPMIPVVEDVYEWRCAPVLDNVGEATS